jgi:hypothetical protein
MAKAQAEVAHGWMVSHIHTRTYLPKRLAGVRRRSGVHRRWAVFFGRPISFGVARTLYDMGRFPDRRTAARGLEGISSMELDARCETRHEPDRGESPASALFRQRGEELFGRIVPAGRPARAPVRPAADKASARQLRRCDPDLVPMRASAPPVVKDTLLVDPDIPDIRGVGAVEAALRLVADVEVCTDFRNARARLLHKPPDLLITNLRLGAYNGLHLVHLAAATRTRCIVFSTHDDLGLAREVQAAGAFFELPVRLPQVLESYVNATLPHHDRRNITMLGQLPCRGGRRCTDR